MNKIKRGDFVFVKSGKCKGQKGKVISSMQDKVIVEGVGMVKKHIKPNPNRQIEGGVSKKESFIHISNIALYDSPSENSSKIGFKFLENSSKKVRYFKLNNKVVD